MKPISKEQLHSCKNILSFWHKVEFFIPFDLEGQVLDHWDKDWAVKAVTSKALNSLALDDHGSLWKVGRIPKEKQLYAFDLYVGVFDKSRSVEIVQKAVRSYLDSALSENAIYEQSERADLEGYTCFAKIKVSATGEPSFDEVSVSTLPWALGRVNTGGLENLDITEFNRSLRQLEDDLRTFAVERRPCHMNDAVNGAAIPPKANTMPLTRRDLEGLEKIFAAWAGFEPDGGGATRFVIHARVGKAKKLDPEKVSLQAPEGSRETEKTEHVDSGSAVDDDEEGDEADPNSKIDILNSFYLLDIQRAIHDVENGSISPVLCRYLLGLVGGERVDLYQNGGADAILTGLMPNLQPKARWMGDPAQPMSLMQQFAINNAMQLAGRNEIYSVNGPPGTGKTTLLRDIFADIFVCRARVLAKCGSAKDALCEDDKKIEVTFEDGTTTKITPLEKKLTGFEMVVASSNNAAVENISIDLPKTKSLGSIKHDGESGETLEGLWRKANGAPKYTYLQPVANRIAAQNSKGTFDKLSLDDTPWGLFAAVLGNRKNRTRFATRLSFSPKQSDPQPEGFDEEIHQSLWEWIRNPGLLSFSEAKKTFNKADKAVTERLQQLQALVDLSINLKGKTEADYIGHAAKVAAEAKARLQRLKSASDEAKEQLHQCETQLADFVRMQVLLRGDKHPWWKRWFKHADYVVHLERLAVNRNAQQDALRQKISAQRVADAAKKLVRPSEQEYLGAIAELDEKIKLWKDDCSKLEALRCKFLNTPIPSAADELNDEKWQREGLWHDEELAKLRSELFAAALGLQQSWLAEVLRQKGMFGGNVFALCKLLQGGRLSDPQLALPIWQSLFMVVPVISSTFASVASQFRELGRDSLGWLFIDEAGQAVPQAAVGGLWRSRRAVVVGDPLQIEPVFTVPIKLIEALAKSSALPDGLKVMPHQHSVQNLADEANRLGAQIESIGDFGQWIGSPLRVHRRCANPMFDIANLIAYEGKMVYGLQSDEPPKGSLDLGDSAWVHVDGQVVNKQVVQEQIDVAIRALVLLYHSIGEMPSLYIISPFKAIKRELIERMLAREEWVTDAKESGAPSESKLKEWCKKHVGTVHTFQGKENSIVWMVLGCDEERDGGANWASSKPNLLNVALTRAQHRFFIIGDVNVWGKKRYFGEARESLAIISAKQFHERMVCDFEVG